MARPRIVLLHATPVAVQPITSAFKALWPEADTVNLLDDSLSPDRARMSELTDVMIERFVSFGRHSRFLGADGILVTCSAFGPAIEQLAREVTIPVIKPNEAMFAKALKAGKRIGMLATFKPSIATMEAEFDEFVTRDGVSSSLRTVLVEGAMDSLRAGDAATHNRLIADRAPVLGDVDAVMLAHFSTSIALEAVQSRLVQPVLTAPETAVRRMRELVN
jgi:Asp/Glu/hydantoin racemase